MLVCGCVGCGYEPLPLSRVASGVRGIAVGADRGLASWIVDDVRGAFDFWAEDERGVEFVLGDGGDIVVADGAEWGDGHDELIRAYADARWVGGVATVFVFDVEAYEGSCSVAHGLGLALGLTDRDGDGLMSLTFAARGETCPWSAADAQQLKRLLDF